MHFCVTMWRQLRAVFALRGSWRLFVMIAAGAFVVVRTLPHTALLWQFFWLPTVTWARRAEVWWSYAFGSLADATLYDRFVSLGLPVALALNVVVMRAYWKRQMAVRTHGATSILGMLFGTFGIGCFACKGLVLAPLLAAMGVSGVVAALPLRGMEFGAVGIVMLAGSTAWMLSVLARPQVCALSDAPRVQEMTP